MPPLRFRCRRRLLFADAIADARLIFDIILIAERRCFMPRVLHYAAVITLLFELRAVMRVMLRVPRRSRGYARRCAAWSKSMPRAAYTRAAQHRRERALHCL